MVTRVVILACLLLGACKFDEHDFGDRSCTTDQECEMRRPDLACIEGACTARPCSSDTACGTGFEYSCRDNACVAKECSDSTPCDIGFACNMGFCQASFNVVSAASASNTSIAVTFDAPPDETTATTASNYMIDGLTVSGTPTLSGSTVTLTTSPQTMSSYMVTVTNVVRASDKAPLIIATGSFTGRKAFGVMSAMSTSSITVQVTFSDPPNAALATNLTNYTIPGLTLSGTPTLSGNSVTLTTNTQGAQNYTVNVNNVRRASDDEAMTTKSTIFAGRQNFNVASAAATSTTTLVVTFDGAPSAGLATNLANYSVVPALALSGTPVVSGNTVTLTTEQQADTTYAVTVANVTRAADMEPLTTNNAQFNGRAPFDVTSVSPLTSRSIAVTFDAPPDPTAAVNVNYYSIPGLTLSAPVLVGNTVTLTTTTQSAMNYTLTVMVITRASDMEALSDNTATFVGRPPFNVMSAASTSSSTVDVTFDGAPNSGQAAVATNYSIPNLTVISASTPVGNVVTLTTSPQSATNYAVTVSNVTRAGDGEALTTVTRNFTGRAPFNVMTAAAPTSNTITVTFDAAPNMGAALNLANYDVPGLTLSAPSLNNNTVTLTTTPMANQMYTITVSGVTRSADGEPLTVDTANFAGRAKFNVASAQSASNVLLKVTFDAPPNSGQATNINNYSVNNGLTLSGTPTLSGNTVTITTSSQVAGTNNYTVTVTGVTRNGDAEPLNTNTAQFSGLVGFNVISAASVNTTTMTVTFDALPKASEAQTLGNYVVTGNGGLTLSGTPVLNAGNNTVTITTSPQVTGTYTVTVNGVTRNSDSSPLVVKSANFSYVSFNVTGAAALSNHSATLTYDALPNAGQATTAGNYAAVCSPNPCTNITLSSPTLNGSVVTFTTTAQQAGKTYTITANNVTRNSDGSILTNKTGSFVGRASFNVSSATAPTSGTAVITFDAAPNLAQAQTLSNYTIGNLTLTGTPVVNGNTVTINTSVQANQNYAVTVTGVTRASDAEPLFVNTATLAGKAQVAPTVTNVVVQSTVPDNGTTFYNTGSATVVITGTEFNGVNCLTGVKLDDLDGLGALQNTKPTSCTVDSATQITATFPSGIRSIYSGGWNVQVTNSVNTNATSSVKLFVKAGLLISEVFVGVSGTGNGSREFFELYNPTANSLNIDTVGIKFHIRNAAGTDVTLAPTFGGGNCSMGTCTKDIPSHKFWTLVSTTTDTTNDAWYAKRNGFYNPTTAELVVNGGLYINVGAANQKGVIDKVGWGTQAAIAGREGTGITAFGDDNKSAQRKPGGTSGAGTDTDANSSDFNTPNTTISPKCTRDPAEP